MTAEQVARSFVLHAIQEWGDPEERRIAAVQGVLDAAGFKATATCWPVFGGIWRQPCAGPDGDAATDWLELLTEKMPRGKFENEVAYVAAEIQARSDKLMRGDALLAATVGAPIEKGGVT